MNYCEMSENPCQSLINSSCASICFPHARKAAVCTAPFATCKSGWSTGASVSIPHLNHVGISLPTIAWHLTDSFHASAIAKRLPTNKPFTRNDGWPLKVCVNSFQKHFGSASFWVRYEIVLAKPDLQALIGVQWFAPCLSPTFHLCHPQPILHLLHIYCYV